VEGEDRRGDGVKESREARIGQGRDARSKMQGCDVSMMGPCKRIFSPSLPQGVFDLPGHVAAQPDGEELVHLPAATPELTSPS
jgi:hypothetical protein